MKSNYYVIEAINGDWFNLKVQGFNTLPEAYRHWFNNQSFAQIVKSVEIEVVEKS